MFWQDLDPGYYQNPAAYTYLIYALFRVMYGPLGFLFDLPFGNVTDQFDKNPTEMWIAARALAAVLCTAGVAATYWAARRLWGVREGLVAAALLAFAFLPVAYSRVAVTDVGALLGVALALGFAVWAYEDGRLRFFAAAGRGGRARAVVQVHGRARAAAGGDSGARPARAGRSRPGARHRPCGRSRGLALGVALAGLVFVALNPYLFDSLDAWWSDLRDQAEVAADQPKPGQESGGVSYYLDSLTWGLGWAAALAALARRGTRAASQPRARPDARGGAAGAVRLPERAVALLRPLAAAGLPGARDAGRAGADARVDGRSCVQNVAHGRASARALAARRLTAARARPAAGRGHPQRAGARPGRHAPAGARLARGALPARAEGVRRARGAGALVPLEPRGRPAQLAEPLRAARRLDRAGLVVRGGPRQAHLRPVQARPRRAPRRRRAGVRLPLGARPGA